MDLNDHWNYLLAGSHGTGAFHMKRQQLHEAACEGMVWVSILIAVVILSCEKWENPLQVLGWVFWTFSGFGVLCLVAMMVNSGRISREEEQNDWRNR